MNLNIHFHILFLDGVYVYRDNRPPRFQRVRAPDKSELEDRVAEIFDRCGSTAKVIVDASNGCIEDQDTMPDTRKEGHAVKRGRPLIGFWITCARKNRTPLFGRSWRHLPEPHQACWTFTSGEAASHTFASTHEIKDGLVYRWKNYWDMQKFVGQFPAWFLEEMMKLTADDFTD